jgi:hypothetical protein
LNAVSSKSSFCGKIAGPGGNILAGNVVIVMEPAPADIHTNSELYPCHIFTFNLKPRLMSLFMSRKTVTNGLDKTAASYKAVSS